MSLCETIDVPRSNYLAHEYDPKSLDNSYWNSDSVTNVPISKLIQTPVYIDYYSLAVNNTGPYPKTLFNRKLAGIIRPDDLFKDSFATYFSYFALNTRYALVFSLDVMRNKNTSGHVIVAVFPKTYDFSDKTVSLATLMAHPHVVIDLQRSGRAEITVPWIDLNEYYPTVFDEGYSNLKEFYANVVVMQVTSLSNLPEPGKLEFKFLPSFQDLQLFHYTTDVVLRATPT
jgi:hypothetical protein